MNAMNKYLFLLVVLVFTFQAKANVVFDKLADINKCWKQQTDVDLVMLPSVMPTETRQQLQLHIALVEQVLRSRNTAHLTAVQRNNRLRALDYLKAYGKQGVFPVNEYLNVRTPVFIDRQDNFCAVGYLVKATGFEEVSRMISAKTNLAYVHDMNYPELFAWAKQFGFTVDELAWIQPGYPPDYHAAAVGKGTNGVVYEMYGNDVSGKLFVGGSFSKVDGFLPAENVAYITETNGLYNYHAMGSGVNGPVYAIAEFDNKIFVGGSFTFAGNKMAKGIACWDGTSWQGTAASCLDGIVKDLVVYHGKLYATGNFKVYPGMQASLAQFTGQCWTPFTGISGMVNTAEVYNNSLVLGGRFKYGNDSLSIIEWSDVSSFKKFDNDISYMVNDLVVHNGQLFAACERPTNHYDFVQKLIGAKWYRDTIDFYPYHNGGNFYSFLSTDDTLLLGGNFYGEANSVYAGNCVALRPYPSPPILAPLTNWFNVDTTIHKLIKFKGNIFAGGVFATGISKKSDCNDAYAHFKTVKGADSVAVYTYNGTKPSWGNWPDSVKWYFGDGDSTITTGFDSIVTHKYKKHGSFLVCAIAYNSCGADRMCDSILIEEKPTGVTTLPGSDLQVYPNPTTGQFTIDNAASGTRVAICDITGKFIAELVITSNRQQVDLSNYLSGVYILQLTHPNGTKQVMKIHRE
jgi:hypothetical protein